MTRAFLLPMLVAALLLSTGCVKQPALTTPTAPAAKPQTADAGDLKLALNSLRKLAEGNDGKPAQRTIYYLNQWISSDPGAAADWQPDRMLDSLPRALRKSEGLDRLSKLQFTATSPYQWLDDISYLQQTLWLHDIAARIRRQPPDKSLEKWLRELEKSVGLPEAEQLGTAERLFDWVVRNIQLDALPPTPQAPLATAGTGETQLPSERGEVGPGYGHLPLEVLMYGHGDAQERARIFILLCRQAGIDAVMLGFQEEQSAGRRGWLPGVLIADKLYLFEPALGLPVPGPEGQGIATLDQVLKEPQLLKGLDVAGQAYAIGEKDLKPGVLAMIDADPAALSRRMQLLQAAMPAAARLALTTQPSKIDAALRKAKASSVSLWPVAFDAVLYRIGLQTRAAREPEIAIALHRQNFLFAPARPLIKARNLHLQGRFENEEQKPGARALYLQCRPPDREIDAMNTNEFYRKTIGLDQTLPADPVQKQAALNSITDVAREGKFDATYWLGLTYAEIGKPQVAIEWLGERTVEVSPPSPWTPGARYNLARCYEELGQLDLARKWLESDKDSPQRPGNLLRAKRLAKAEAP